jgi:hypothetical protein
MINIRYRNNAPGLSQPIGQLSLQVQVPKSYGFGKDWLGNADHRRRVTSQRGVFAVGRGHRTNPLKLVYLISESPRFLQELCRARFATPNPYRGKHRQRGAT